MGRIAEESIRKVAEANDIVDVIGGYIRLKKAGSIFKGLCPFHKEKTPSFTVSPARQSYKCFGCQAGGGVIRFVMDYEQAPFASAVRKLADRAGIHLIEESGGPGDDVAADRRRRLLDLHQRAAAWFHQLLLKDPRAEAARAYLEERGIGRETIDRWLLGYAPGSGGALHSMAAKAGYSTEEIIASGLCGEDRENDRMFDRFRDRITIPIQNDFGETIGFSARVLNPEASPAKYINSPETPIFSKGRILFGLAKTKRALIQSGVAIVCEGQFDLISAFENGVENVIAPQGTAFTPEQARLLKRFVPMVILCFDADAAGQKAVERSLPALLRNGLEVRVLLLEAGEDPDSMIRKLGGEAFRKLADESPDLVTYLVGRERAAGNLETPAGLSAAARKMAGILRNIEDVVQRDAMVNLAADQLRIPPSQLVGLLRSSKPEPVYDEEEPTDSPSPMSSLRLGEDCALLCRLTLSCEGVKEWLLEQSNPSPLDLDGEWEMLATILQSDFHPSNPQAFPALLNSLSPAAQQLLAGMDTSYAPEHPVEKAAATWRGFLRLRIERERELVKSKLRTKGLSTKEVLEIQKELLDLQKRLLDVTRPVSSEA